LFSITQAVGDCSGEASVIRSFRARGFVDGIDEVDEADRIVFALRQAT
jgi:hypothetical protein